jgi:uncharacterized protein (TIGR01777 family)
VHVFVTGATGLIGRALVHALLGRGDFVTALSRAPDAANRLPPGVRHLQGDPARPGRWEDELARTDACVHLAGEPIAAGRWTAERRRRIRASRVDSTRRVAEVVRAGGPSVLVSGSAVGIYGDRGDEELDESAAPGEGFLPEVCVEWEAAAAPARARARVVLLRTGIVLAREGGALPRMALPFRLLAGGPLAGGGFWQPWIHVADEIGLVLLALDRAEAEGPLNAAAPVAARNRDLAGAMGAALHRPAILPAPRFAIRAVLGALADDVLASQRVVPRKALALGYAFRFPEVGMALQDLLRP